MNLITYNSFNELLNVINAPEPLHGRDNESRDGDASFTGTQDWDEAYQLFIKGDRESFNKIKEKRSHLKKYQDALIEHKHRKPTNQVEGTLPNVPNYLMGVPNNMIRYETVTKKRKIVRIFYNRSAVWSISSGKLSEFGVYIASLINGIELSGRRVELWIGSVYQGRKGLEGWRIKLKGAREPLNLYKLSFSLVNPSFLRRIDFAVSEREPRLSNTTTHGYGTVVSDSDTLKQINAVDKGIVLDYDSLEKLISSVNNGSIDLDEYVRKGEIDG